MNKKITAFILMISMMLPGLVFADDTLTEIAVNQYAEASSELSEECAAEKANDGINDNADYSAWRSEGNDKRPYWQTDLAIAYKISVVEIEARKDGDSEERSNFRVLASNDPEFSEYEIIGECKEDYGENIHWVASFETRNRYQYIRVEKTVDGPLSIGEIRIYVKKSSILYGTEEKEKNIQYPVTDVSTRYDLPEDVVGTSIEKQVRFLASLNIMRGYPDGNFLPDGYITRAEFAVVVVRLINNTLHLSENTFNDVPKDYWAYDAIEACYESGTINGVEKGSFAPEEYITYDQAVKIIVCALGYGELAKSAGGYPEGYKKVAVSLGILDGVVNDNGSITRGDIAKLCYLSLFARLMNRYDDTPETLLSKSFNLLKIRGLVTEITGLSLTDDSLITLKDNYIVVNGLKLITDNPYYRDWFGYEVEVYYREDSYGGYEAVVVVPSDKGKEFELSAEDVKEFDTSCVLRYYDNERVRRIAFKKDLDVIYNNKPLKNYSHNTVIPSYGTIKAIDYDSDGKYDIMVIKAVKTYVVNWVNANERIIYPKAFNNKATVPIEYSDDDIVNIYNTEGENVEFSELAEWNVLSVEMSANTDGERVVDIYISDVFARGVVDFVDENYVTVRNKQYKIAETINMSNIKPGDKGIFYLDCYGRIAAFDGDKSEHGKYGFITRAYSDEVDENVFFRVFTSNGIVNTYRVSDKLTIDGAKCKTKDEVMNALLLGGGTNGKIQQLVRYSANSKNELIRIDTVYRNPQYESIEDDTLTKDFESASRHYKSGTGIFGMVLSLADDAVIIRLPEDLTNENKYEIVSRSSFEGDTSHTFEAYDAGELNCAKAAVILPGTGDSLLDTGSFCVVDKIAIGINKDEEVVSILRGWYKGKYIEYMESEAGIISSAGLTRGDIICFSLSSDNEIKKIEKRFYNGTKPVDAPVNSISVSTPMGPTNHTPYWNLFLVYGTVTAREGNMIKIQADTSQGQTLSQPDYENIITNLDGQVYKYIYDSENDEVRLAENSDFVDEKSAASGNASKVVYRVNSGNVCDIVILK